MTNNTQTTTKYVTKIKRDKSANSNRISELYSVDNKEAQTNGTWEPASEVIIHIKYDLREYRTLSENGDSAKIEVDKIEGIYYLTTVPNGNKEDNLGNLPEVE